MLCLFKASSHIDYHARENREKFSFSEAARLLPKLRCESEDNAETSEVAVCKCDSGWQGIQRAKGSRGSCRVCNSSARGNVAGSALDWRVFPIRKRVNRENLIDCLVRERDCVIDRTCASERKVVCLRNAELNVSDGDIVRKLTCWNDAVERPSDVGVDLAPRRSSLHTCWAHSDRVGDGHALRTATDELILHGFRVDLALTSIAFIDHAEAAARRQSPNAAGAWISTRAKSVEHHPRLAARRRERAWARLRRGHSSKCHDGKHSHTHLGQHLLSD
mmetsp:Transcript_14265/g.38252  ORF Transcript_14265/g.38252 Transcript_14265/m.38252 type:complete len:276 (+) Transcript_14265:932-1759(+)